MPKILYCDYVTALAHKQQPRLRLLADFLSDTFRISGYHSDQDVQRRMTDVNVTVIEYSKCQFSSNDFTDCMSLSTHLNNPISADASRFVFAEGLSRDVIEILGSRYDLDPRFFENHLRGLEDFLADRWTGDRTHRLESSIIDVFESSI